MLVKKKQVRRFWRRGIFKNRKLHSEYYNVCQTLRDSDREFHYQSVRSDRDVKLCIALAVFCLKD